MEKKESEDRKERIEKILQLLLLYSQLDFEQRGKVSKKGDELDAIMAGLNTLAEELTAAMGNSASKSIEEDTARLAAIVDSSDDAIISKNLLGVIRTWNKSAERIFGYKAEEAIGKQVDIIIPPEKLSEEKEIIHKITEGEKVDHFETVRKRKDGNKLCVSITVSPVRDRNGTVIGASTIARDISDRKEAEQEVRLKAEYMASRVNELLEVLLKYTLLDFSVVAKISEKGDEFDAIAVGLNTMAEELQAEINRRKAFEEALVERTNELVNSNRDLENFAYVASHDLQEPLRMVSSFLQLLQKKLGTNLDQDSKEYIFYAVDGAKRMKDMINDLLSYSRVTSKKAEFAQLDLNVVMKEVLDDLSRKIEESGAKVEYEQLPVITADRIKMTRLFMNLVGNALKFAKKGEPPKVRVLYTDENTMHRFTVQDEGIGMKPEYFNKIFGIFQRLHSQVEYPGTGIGLAECKKIVELHGGTIWVESEPGHGSAFHFTISKKLKPGATN